MGVAKEGRSRSCLRRVPEAVRKRRAGTFVRGVVTCEVSGLNVSAFFVGFFGGFFSGFFSVLFGVFFGVLLGGLFIVFFGGLFGRIFGVFFSVLFGVLFGLLLGGLFSLFFGGFFGAFLSGLFDGPFRELSVDAQRAVWRETYQALQWASRFAVRPAFRRVFA